jgi:hypothetical protein
LETFFEAILVKTPALQKPEGVAKGEVVAALLQSLGNAGSDALRLSRKGKKGEKTRFVLDCTFDQFQRIVLNHVFCFVFRKITTIFAFFYATMGLMCCMM